MNLPLFTKAKIIKNAKFHPSIFDLKKIFLISFFCISSRSRWVLSAPEEKIQKFVDSAKKKIHQNSLKFIKIRMILNDFNKFSFLQRKKTALPVFSKIGGGY